MGDAAEIQHNSGKIPQFWQVVKVGVTGSEARCIGTVSLAASTEMSKAIASSREVCDGLQMFPLLSLRK